MASYIRLDGRGWDQSALLSCAMTMRRLLDCLLLLGAVAAVHCQFSDDYGPAPPRLLIPGAVPLGPAPSAPRRPVRLQARRQQIAPEPTPAPAPRLRSRPSNGRAGRLPLQPSPQPTLPPSPPPQQFFSPSFAPVQQRPLPQQNDAPIRPVIEETEDDYEEDTAAFSPAPTPSTPPPPPPPPPAPQRPVFRPERPALLPTPAPELNFVSPPRQQLRPAPSVLPDDDERPRKYNRVDQSYTSRNKVRPTPAPEDPQFSRQYNRAQSVVRAPQKPVYNSPAKQDYEQPTKAQRPRKPVAQVLRRYREENDDGSITWGYENDDGSFKEETIGTDCVTYGKYGYIDPDGTRREYTYSTGIPCDKEKDSQNQASEGYIDYAENKYVLPSGETIDLNKMVKNRARKPVNNIQYRN